MKSKFIDTINNAEIDQPFKIPPSKEGSLKNTIYRVEKATGKKFKTKTIKYKEVTRVK
jgi:hypothetical protein